MELTYPDPILGDDVVGLRPWAAGDVDCVREAGSDPYLTSVTTVPASFTAAAGLAFVERQRRRIETGEGVSLALTEATTDRAVGSLWLPVRAQPGVLGLGYWIVPAARGRGLGTRAVRLAAHWALTGIADVYRVEAWVEPDNVASQRLLVAAGFEREGLLRSFLSFGERRADAVVFSRVR